MKTLLKMVIYQPRLWLANLVFMLIFMLLIQGQALVIEAFFDHLTGEAPTGFNVWTLVAILFAIRLGRNIGQVLDILTSVPFHVKVTALLRSNMLRYLLLQAGVLPASSGEATNRFRGDAPEIAGFLIWLNRVLGIAAFLLVALWTMLRINSWITFVALLPFLVITAIARGSAQRLQAHRSASRQATGQVVGFIGEMFGAVQAIQIATAQAGVLQRFTRLNQQRRNQALRDRLFNEIIQSISQNAVNISTGLVLILSHRLMQQGRFTIAEFAVFVYYLEQLSYFIGQFSLVLARYRHVKVATERMDRLAPQEVLTEPIPITSEVVKPRAPLSTLEIQQLSYHYPGSQQGIHDISFRIERGQMLAITGAIGTGKTTLLRVLLGLLPKQSGAILWNRQPVEHLRFPYAAYTPQVPRLYSDTLRENILLGLPHSDEEVFHLLKQVEFDQDLRQLPDQLDTHVGAKGVKLSGGQVQRVATARMLLRQPELLIVDDLSSALDIHTEEMLLKKMLIPETTIIIVSHRPLVLAQADQVIVL